MRQIKFRLIHNKKIVGYEKWYNGHKNIHNDYEALPCWLYSNDDEYYCPIFINHRFKDAFTGLHDAKENPIYESDILHIEHFIFYVCYDHGSFIVKENKESDTWFSLSNINKFSLIMGNIHENEDLL